MEGELTEFVNGLNRGGREREEIRIYLNLWLDKLETQGEERVEG